MAKIYYVGDWAILTGPNFIETPFHQSMKGLDVFNYGRWVTDAWEAAGHEVTSVPSWDFYKLGPGAFEDILDLHDVIVLSDVEGKILQVAPAFFDRAAFGREPLTFPDRARLLGDAVRKGKGLVLMGGWYSFTGELGRGGWGRTRLRDILPVRCLEHEDLVESTEGFSIEVTAAGREQFETIRWDSCPPILGYNEVRELPESTVLLRVRETGDPLLATRRVGAGVVLAFMSDPAPHWGCNFVSWPAYTSFWQECLEVVGASRPTGFASEGSSRC